MKKWTKENFTKWYKISEDDLFSFLLSYHHEKVLFEVLFKDSINLHQDYIKSYDEYISNYLKLSLEDIYQRGISLKDIAEREVGEYELL